MVSFRREKFVPLGGPSGGDGGNGGNVLIKAVRKLNTLYELSFRRTYKADPGGKGMAKDMFGARGEDLIVEVPVGTMIFDTDTGELLADLTSEDAVCMAGKGGRGGRGNARFVSSVQRAPRIAEKGEPGEARNLRLELKLLADVGLIGLPNAGKSTFLRAVSNARPKVADYPFTTLHPHLGIVKPEGCPSFCMADLPGLIEGAHSGAGLGIQFLKHIERTRILLHLVDLAVESHKVAIDAFKTVMGELKQFNPRVAEKPLIIVANKLDLPAARANWDKFSRSFARKGIPVVGISAAAAEGVSELLKKCSGLLSQPLVEEPLAITEKKYVFLPPFAITVEKPGYIQVAGKEIQRLVEMTDFTSEPAIERFRKRLRKMGFIEALGDLNAGDRDTVVIGTMEFYYEEFFR